MFGTSSSITRTPSKSEYPENRVELTQDELDQIYIATSNDTFGGLLTITRGNGQAWLNMMDWISQLVANRSASGEKVGLICLKMTADSLKVTVTGRLANDTVVANFKTWTPPDKELAWMPKHTAQTLPTDADELKRFNDNAKWMGPALRAVNLSIIRRFALAYLAYSNSKTAKAFEDACMARPGSGTFTGAVSKDAKVTASWAKLNKEFMLFTAANPAMAADIKTFIRTKSKV